MAFFVGCVPPSSELLTVFPERDLEGSSIQNTNQEPLRREEAVTKALPKAVSSNHGSCHFVTGVTFFLLAECQICGWAIAQQPRPSCRFLIKGAVGEYFSIFFLPCTGLAKEGREGLLSRDVNNLRVSPPQLLRLRWCLLGFSTIKLGFSPWQHEGRLDSSQHCESILEYIPASSPLGSVEWPVQQALRWQTVMWHVGIRVLSICRAMPSAPSAQDCRQ